MILYATRFIQAYFLTDGIFLRISNEGFSLAGDGVTRGAMWTHDGGNVAWL